MAHKYKRVAFSFVGSRENEIKGLFKAPDIESISVELFVSPLGAAPAKGATADDGEAKLRKFFFTKANMSFALADSIWSCTQSSRVRS